MSIVDPIVNGLAAGWQHINASQLKPNQQFEVDVVIVGTGAGGGTSAEILTQGGLKVLLIEAGALKSSKDFNMEERRAYPDLYQQSGALKTSDKAIGIFQGRAVGGSTTVNWTTSIRTPKPTLEYWAAEKFVAGLSEAELAPWFNKMESRLNIHEWQLEPNRNNLALRQGCSKLGWQYTVIKRNVAACWNTGYCGMGCPINAKQSMLVTTIPSALNAGASLISQARVTRLVHSKDKITGLEAVAQDTYGHPLPITFTVKAKHYLLAAGAIHTPRLMMASGLTDPYQLLGKRTFLHPTLLSGAVFNKPIYAHAGAPQSIYSDEFVWKHGVTGKLGYKLEVPPVHPVLFASKSMGYGQSHAQLMSDFNNLQVTIALIRDGFHADSQGGEVKLTDSGYQLDYPLTSTFWQAAKEAFLSMAELQFAAGARKVLPISQGMDYLTSWREAKLAIENMELAPLKTVVASAHVMGGCAMGEDKKIAMVNSQGEAHYYENLSVMDGSIFPTSLGANPQLSIYGIVAKNATMLAQRLQGENTKQPQLGE